MASISKRQQARNERELQDLIHAVPGNNQCADCGARNPGWASWSLGIFLCMRCASIHRKLGTHISKVKSLSMDTWSAEQVESMKRNGNFATNKTYNPKNTKPDIPLDADEVDSAMERFIRKKYQEKSLAGGKPLPPTRSRPDAGISLSPENSPPPPLPPKKGKFFGFGLRASSSAYSLSKHDKKSLPKEPRVDSAFRISSENFDAASRSPRGQKEISDEEMQTKLATLRDMGFPDARRNITVLKGLDGNMERTIESLVRIQQVSRTEDDVPISTGRTVNAVATSVIPPRSTQFAGVSNNPFDQTSSSQSFGLSFDAASPQYPPAGFAATPERRLASNNPFDVQQRRQTDQHLEQAFQNMQVSPPLFPHNTGGYPSQPTSMHDPRFQHSMTPPVPLIPHQYGYMASPTIMANNTNPFFQSAQSSPTVASNPYASLMQSPPPLATSSNPFFNQMGQNATVQRSSSNFNPFGIPPTQPGSPPQQRSVSQPQSFYEQSAQSSAPINGFQNFSAQQNLSQQAAQSLQQQNISQPTNYEYVQPQYQQQQTSFQSQDQFSYNQQNQPQSLLPQQTGRVDKSSILALYNYPHLAPQPLASIPEPAETQQQMQPNFQQHSSFAQPISPAPSSADDIFSSMPHSQGQSARRSATMPVSAASMHSAGGGGSRNPFLNMSNNSSNNSTPMPGYGAGIGARHASAESVSVNNPVLEGGRHSPDAFASLSARYR